MSKNTVNTFIMRKDIWLFIVIAAIAIPYFWLKFRPEPDFRDLIKPNGYNIKIDESYRQQIILEIQINALLSERKCDSAEQKTDTALSLYPNNDYFINLKGQSLMCKGQTQEALKWFHAAVSQNRTPLSLGNRAEAFTILKKYDSALTDLKECVFYNKDYNQNIGLIYQKKGVRDSAIYYYEVFLGYYPDSIRIQKKILKLKKLDKSTLFKKD